MGEAKRNREELRATMIAQAEAWTLPPSEWEATVVEAISALPVYRARRMPEADIRWMRMPTKQCHANVRWYVRNDPTKESKIAAGWWVQGTDFLLHSVLENENRYACIAPTPFHEDSFDFIPDRQIEWKETGDVYTAFRNGQAIPSGVRMYPAFTIARSNFVIQRLRSGMNPYEAIDIPRDTFKRLMEEYLPASVVEKARIAEA